ncbi:DUF397 domain-containing protein [Streptomyces sp. GMR22]|uniref:DUF397 domain-containing protein n=1 Tax=Streptomyces sp. GMR22 TaxID=2759524 RepID=UPI0015FB9B30|nr:DUF397 domain-containing protein [Streptomyces sp. GMR22]MBA6437796.1 DUF397 domain-containing protein [Streptomyces sp. GMR22]MBI0376995.1 DUF397 domain-containing protein [Streptomyces albiflaviniger]
MHEHTWQRSSFCGGGGNNCIEVAADDSDIAIRESSEPSAVLHTDRIALRTFISGVKRGHFDRLLN